VTTRWITCWGFLLAGSWGMSLAGQAAPMTLPIPVAADAAASRAALAQAQARGRCLLGSLAGVASGTLMTGSSPVVPEGRYRLHLPLALVMGERQGQPLSITVTVNDVTRTLTPLAFPTTPDFTIFSLDVTQETAGPITLNVKWAIDKKAKVTAVTPLPLDPEADAEEGSANGELVMPAPDGTVSLRDLPRAGACLATYGVCLETRCPIQLHVRAEKLVYTPGERGAVTVTMVNTSPNPVTAQLVTSIQAGLAREVGRQQTPIALAGRETKTLTGAFDTQPLYWGAAFTATVTIPDARSETQSSVFGVSVNCWETAIATFAKLTESPRQLRDAGFTLLECFFWSPDNFGDFTPESEQFFGGESTYPGTISGTKAFIAEAHQHGLAVTVYADLWGGDGPPSFEMMRKHPDWFWSAGVNNAWIENWPLMARGKIPPMHVWPYTQINQQNWQPAMAVHADELVASHRQFGWDGVRYDSYYSSEWTKQATKFVRDRVERAWPRVRWGYNSLVVKDVNVNALDIMIGGGGLVMEEGIKKATQSPASLTKYAQTLATYRDLIWPHGGHLGVCYSKAERDSIPLDELYLSAMLLACGGHPYGPLENQYGEFPTFALRYSEYLYDNRMRPVPNPETLVQFGGTPKLVEWRRLLRTREFPDGRQRLVIHLINAPVDDLTRHNATEVRPAPLRNLPISVVLPAGAIVEGAWALSPMPTAHHDALPVTMAGATATVQIPEVRLWEMVVLDYRMPGGGR
jgi:hypothetical protein